MGESNICLAEEIQINSAQVICRSPAILFDVTLTAHGGDMECQVYDGENVYGEKKVFIRATNGTTARWNPGIGVRINSGIYVVPKSDKAIVMVTFLPLERHE